MKALFFGTPHFAVPTLRRLSSSRHQVLAVLTNPDRPRGRGRHLAAPPVKEAAQELGLEVLQPASLEAPALGEQLATYGADVFVVVAFSILPPPLLALPRLGCVNLHPSLLPAYRGAAPLIWALFNGEAETGITTFLLNPRVDAGDILLQEQVSIGPDETAGELEGRICELGADLVVETLDQLEDGTVSPRPQGKAGSSRAPKLSREDGRLDWTWPTEVLRNRVRGANPMPGAFTEWQAGPLKIHRARTWQGDRTGDPGSVLEADAHQGLVVATGDGGLLLDLVQPAGKPRMEGTAFVRGHCIAPGDHLGAAQEG